jgi:hypothetical protein
MQEADLYRIFTDKLNEYKISYAVTGSVASIIYGEPRMTHDVDIVIEMKTDDVIKISEAFPANEFYTPPSEVIKIELKKRSRGHLNIIHHQTGFKADIYFTGSDQFQLWCINNARKFKFNNSIISAAPPEYVIIKKLEFYKEGGSEKHIEDIKSILIHSEKIIDFTMLKEFVARYGLHEEWNKCAEM